MNRRELMISAVAAGMFFRTGAAAAFERVPRPAEASKWALWYRQPAEYWVEALPVGTGRLGAMAFGGTGTETLQLNEDTFWAGGPYDPSHDDARPALDEIRSLIWQEKWAEAQDLTNASFMARPLQQMPYQTLGNLKLESAAGEKVSNYRRWLDLATAAAITAWTW